MDENNMIPLNNKENDNNEMNLCDLFPIVEMDNDISKYQKIPVLGLAELGIAFSQIPEAMRTITTTVTKSVDMGETLFVGINPKGTAGYLTGNEFGINGNIMQINEEGKHIIGGRLRFQPIDSVPIKEVTETVIPFNPELLMIAGAVMMLEMKLDSIQSSIEEVLNFLKLEKQSELRGNYNKLKEIAEEYKDKCNDKDFCATRVGIVQIIETNALKNIEFYQATVNEDLRKQKMLHLQKHASDLQNSIIYDFAEYQLASFIYAYSNFLDIMLRHDFSELTINKTKEKFNKYIKRYNELYSNCHSQIAEYQWNAIDAKLIGGIGIAAKGLGKAVGSIPIIKENPVEDLLNHTGTVLAKKNKEMVMKRMDDISKYQDNRMGLFINSLSKLDMMYNVKNSILTDGENLYYLDSNS